MSSPVQINLNRGSDVSWTMALNGPTGVAADITGWTFTVLEVIPAALASAVTCVVTNGPTGQLLLTLPWSSNWPTGEGTKVSIRIRPSGLPVAFPEFVVNLQ